jgi:hypothetical protein
MGYQKVKKCKQKSNKYLESFEACERRHTMQDLHWRSVNQYLHWRSVNQDLHWRSVNQYLHWRSVNH